jgi:hypothetical protein
MLAKGGEVNCVTAQSMRRGLTHGFEMEKEPLISLSKGIIILGATSLPNHI